MWSSHKHTTTSRSRTMDDVWRDITLHHDRPISPPPPTARHSSRNIQCPCPSASPSFRGMILQDFFTAGALKEVSSFAAADHLPHPATALSLKSGVDFHCCNAHSNSTSNSDSSHAQQPQPQPQHEEMPFLSSAFSGTLFGSPPPAAGLFSFCPEKRGPERADTGDGDRRQKRMIKNRESASRSRARKQAYTNELEQEVSHLEEENRMLKKKCEELRLALANQQPNRNSLQRTLTAPF